MLNKYNPYLLALLGTIIIVVFTQISFDLPLHKIKIPITGQSLAVLLVAGIAGRKIGTLSVLFYLILGILGIPVFAKGAAGIGVFTKGSGGFLYGFLIAAFVVGWMADLGWRRVLAKSLVINLLGTVLILFFGILHLSFLYGFSLALEYGFYPFWPGALVKIILGGFGVYFLSLVLKN